MRRRRRRRRRGGGLRRRSGIVRLKARDEGGVTQSHSLPSVTHRCCVTGSASECATALVLPATTVVLLAATVSESE
jgi:hypothetical protein